MFVKIQTWFPSNVQVYINSRKLMKHVLDTNGIIYQCYDNPFADIGDIAKVQELADKFDSAGFAGISAALRDSAVVFLVLS